MPTPNVLASRVQHCATIVESFLRLSYAEELLITSNQCASLVDASIVSNPIRRNVHGSSLDADFRSHAFLQLTQTMELLQKL